MFNVDSTPALFSNHDARRARKRFVATARENSGGAFAATAVTLTIFAYWNGPLGQEV